MIAKIISILPPYQSLPSALTVISANIEGLLVVKVVTISDLCKEQHYLPLSVPSRNTPRCKKIEAPNSWNDTRSRTSARQIWERYFHQRLSEATAVNHVDMITTELPNVVVHYVYKPPIDQFVLHRLGHRILPQIVIGDFLTATTPYGATTIQITTV